MTKPGPKQVITEPEIERVLEVVKDRLDQKFRSGILPANSDEFEEWVIDELNNELTNQKLPLVGDHIDQQFPDLTVANMGIEVKYVSEAKWSGVANSINEKNRIPGLQQIYVIFGRGGNVKHKTRVPPIPIRGVRWGKYEEVVYHARTSHRLRFEIDLTDSKPSLFKRWGIKYEDFAKLSYPEKMGYMQAYARSRQHEDLDLEFWWLPPTPQPYADLPTAEQDEALALACLMCPQIVTGSDQARKEVAVCMQTLKGVLAHEMSTLFSSSPVDDLRRIETVVATEADKAIYDVFQVYWGLRPARGDRLAEWVRRLDAEFIGAAGVGPHPSAVLFNGQYVL